MWHQLKAGSKARSHVHNEDCEPVASTVSAFAFTECKQSGTPRPPRGKEGHDSPHTHPCDCDGLHPLDLPDSVWTRYLQHRSHSQHYGIALAGCAVKDVPTYRERYPIPRLIGHGCGSSKNIKSAPTSAIFYVKLIMSICFICASSTFQ